MPFRVLVAWVLGGGRGGGARRLGLVFVVLETKHASRSRPTPKSPKALEKNGLPIQQCPSQSMELQLHHNRRRSTLKNARGSLLNTTLELLTATSIILTVSWHVHMHTFIMSVIVTNTCGRYCYCYNYVLLHSYCSSLFCIVPAGFMSYFDSKPLHHPKP